MFIDGFSCLRFQLFQASVGQEWWRKHFGSNASEVIYDMESGNTSLYGKNIAIEVPPWAGYYAFSRQGIPQFYCFYNAILKHTKDISELAHMKFSCDNFFSIVTGKVVIYVMLVRVIGIIEHFQIKMLSVIAICSSNCT